MADKEPLSILLGLRVSLVPWFPQTASKNEEPVHPSTQAGRLVHLPAAPLPQPCSGAVSAAAPPGTHTVPQLLPRQSEWENFCAL